MTGRPPWSVGPLVVELLLAAAACGEPIDEIWIAAYELRFGEERD